MFVSVHEFSVLLLFSVDSGVYNFAPVHSVVDPSIARVIFTPEALDTW